VVKGKRQSVLIEEENKESREKGKNEIMGGPQENKIIKYFYFIIIILYIYIYIYIFKKRIQIKSGSLS
jgi:hypothetical protein